MDRRRGGSRSYFLKDIPERLPHLKPLEAALRKRQDKGRNWWELRSCAYWPLFDGPKILYQDITWRASFSLDIEGTYSNNTVYFLPTDDRWVWSVLIRPSAGGSHGERLTWGRRALRYFTTFLEGYPIPNLRKSSNHRVNLASISF